ncbi:DNA-binding transcriptional MerR regulator [Agromyces ramosus]|uniref:DNA-binding transcriptional MerR regulator n=1 Tax=Agromyces ramosus TaxID=33879 RepID=A0A4Q7MNA2_9MICO|nr:MerR family transcriptional regulator [Agromyces ramosus]RZS68262.1 DNA-binding transcriptional MerR regulator [Agromyces ramosus]
MIDEPPSGPPRAPLRTSDVARASGYSVQQVRDLERLGVIPPATRSANGYRAYAAVHVHALRAYRGLAGAIGAVAARQLLTELRGQPIAEAAAAVTSVHVRLARERDEALRAQAALRAIQAEAALPDGERPDDAMTITELAAALGVRASTLRFWEQEGLVSPDRVTSLAARRYGVAAIREARIVAALRSSGYGIPAVRGIMGSLHGLGGIAHADRIPQGRLDRIAARSVALLHASADLAVVVSASASA